MIAAEKTWWLKQQTQQLVAADFVWCVLGCMVMRPQLARFQEVKAQLKR